MSLLNKEIELSLLGEAIENGGLRLLQRGFVDPTELFRAMRNAGWLHGQPIPLTKEEKDHFIKHFSEIDEIMKIVDESYEPKK
jgi:hypothetical protein